MGVWPRHDGLLHRVVCLGVVRFLDVGDNLPGCVTLKHDVCVGAEVDLAVAKVRCVLALQHLEQLHQRKTRHGCRRRRDCGNNTPGGQLHCHAVLRGDVVVSCTKSCSCCDEVNVEIVIVILLKVEGLCFRRGHAAAKRDDAGQKLFEEYFLLCVFIATTTIICTAVVLLIQVVDGTQRDLWHLEFGYGCAEPLFGAELCLPALARVVLHGRVLRAMNPKHARVEVRGRYQKVTCVCVEQVSIEHCGELAVARPEGLAVAAPRVHRENFDKGRDTVTELCMERCPRHENAVAHRHFRLRKNLANLLQCT
eukprot:PhM_4_TR1738/c0_g1_i1/m.86945